MGAGSLIGGIISGYGRAADERNQRLLQQEIDRRKEIVSFYQGVYDNPRNPREIRTKALQNLFEIRQTPYDKKLAKHLLDISLFIDAAAELREPTPQPSAYIGPDAPKPTPEGLVSSAMGEAAEAGVIPYTPPGQEFAEDPLAGYGAPLEFGPERLQAISAAEAEAETAKELNRLRTLRQATAEGPGFIPQTHTQVIAPPPIIAPAGSYVGPRDMYGYPIIGAGQVVPDPGAAPAPGSIEEQTIRQRQLLTERLMREEGRAPTSEEIYESDIQARVNFINTDEIQRAINQLRLLTLQREGGAVLTRNQFDQAARMQRQFTAESAGYIGARDNWGKVLLASQGGTPQADMAMIFSFMRMLDPDSVVREGEYATAEETRGIAESVRTAYNRAIDGFRLGPEQREGFLAEARRIFITAQAQQDELMNVWIQRVTDMNIPPHFVVFDYSQGVPTIGQGGQLTITGGEQPEDFFDPLPEEQ